MLFPCGYSRPYCSLFINKLVLSLGVVTSVSGGYGGLQGLRVVTGGYVWLRVFTGSYEWLRVVGGGYRC